MSFREALKSRKALNAVFAVLLVLALAFVVVVFVKSTAGKPPDGRQPAYDALRAELQAAVADYMSGNGGELPADGSTVTINNSSYHIIDMCALVDGTALLEEVPDSCGTMPWQGDDNCDAGGCSGCSERYHYIWAVDDGGSILSSCAGTECRANGEDGFQNVWP